MNIAATTIARRARGACAPVRAAVPAAAAIAALALTGCTSSPAAAAPHAAPAVTVTVTASPASSPSAPPPAATVTPTPTAAAAAASTAPTSQAGGSLTAKITLLGTTTGLVPGGSSVRFLVTVTNGSTKTYGNILPLVSLSHCGCTASTLFPAGTMRERESTSNIWQTIPYDVEGFGTDFLHADEPGGIQALSPGGFTTFEYRVALDPATSAQVTHGTANIDVTLENLPGHTVIGQSPAASAAIEIMSGAPPA